MINTITLMGRLVRDPELRTTQTGKEVASFPVAVQRSKSKKDDEATRTAKYEAWLENADPDWNKLMLIPVKADYTTTPSYYGQTINSLRSVRHELGLSSTKLEGGKDNPLNLEVIYTRKSAK